MSILSQLFEGKITFDQAVLAGGQWFSTLLTKAPTSVQQDVSQGLSDFKQAASNAVALADTALGPILAVGTVAVNTAVNGALTSATGGAATGLTPMVDAGIDSVINAFHAEIDAVAAQFRASLVGSTTVTVPAPAAGALPSTQGVTQNG